MQQINYERGLAPKPEIPKEPVWIYIWRVLSARCAESLWIHMFVCFNTMLRITLDSYGLGAWWSIALLGSAQTDCFTICFCCEVWNSVLLNAFRIFECFKFRLSLFLKSGFKGRSLGGSGDFSLSPSSSPCRDLSNELGLSSGNLKKQALFFRRLIPGEWYALAILERTGTSFTGQAPTHRFLIHEGHAHHPYEQIWFGEGRFPYGKIGFEASMAIIFMNL